MLQLKESLETLRQAKQGKEMFSREQQQIIDRQLKEIDIMYPKGPNLWDNEKFQRLIDPKWSIQKAQQQQREQR